MDEEDAEEDWVKEQIRKGVSSMATMNQTAPQMNPEQHSVYSQYNMAALPVQSEQASVATIALKGKNALDKLRQDFHRLQVCGPLSFRDKHCFHLKQNNNCLNPCMIFFAQ